MRAAGTPETDRYHFPEIDQPKPNGPPGEQRARRNFLTWAFFLAQASAVELLLTGAAKAQAGEFSENPLTHPDGPQVDGLPNDAMQGKFDVAEAAVITPPSSSMTTLSVAQLVDPPDQTQLSLPAIAGPTPADAAASGSAGAAGAVGSTSQGPVGSSGNPTDSLPNLLPDIGGSERTLPPPITVDIGLTPHLGFDVTIGVGGLITANVGVDLGLLVSGPLQNVTNLLVSPVQGATDLAGPPTNDLGHLLNGDGLGLGGLLPSSQQHLSELTGLTLTDGIAGLVGRSGDNASASASSALHGAQHEPAVALITNATDVAAPTLFGGGGVINILGGPANMAQHDDLYAQGRYTDYNVVLRDNAEPNGGNAMHDIAAALRTPAPTDHPTDTTQHIADLPHFDDLLARPHICRVNNDASVAAGRDGIPAVRSAAVRCGSSSSGPGRACPPGDIGPAKPLARRARADAGVHREPAPRGCRAE